MSSIPAPEHKDQEQYNTWYVDHSPGKEEGQHIDTHYFVLECGMTLYVYDGWHAWTKKRDGVTGWIGTRKDVIWELNKSCLSLTREGQKRMVYWPSVEIGKDKIILAARDVLGRNLKNLPGGLNMSLISHVATKVAKDIVETGGVATIYESERLEIRKNGIIRDNTGEHPDQDYLIRIKTPPDSRGARLMRDLLGEDREDPNADSDFWTYISTKQFHELCRALWSPSDPSVHKTPPKTPEGF